MLTHNNDNFPSDVYTIMEAAGATVTIATSPTDMKTYTLSDFLQVSMTTSLIVSMEIPFLKPNERMCTYKVMPRFQVCLLVLLCSVYMYRDGYRSACDLVMFCLSPRMLMRM